MTSPSTPTAVRAPRSPRVGPGDLSAGQLGGVDGDPDPAPHIVYGPVSPLAYSVDGAAAPTEPPAVDIAPVAGADPLEQTAQPPAPAPSWQQQVDVQRADFGLPPLAGAL